MLVAVTAAALLDAATVDMFDFAMHIQQPSLPAVLVTCTAMMFTPATTQQQQQQHQQQRLKEMMQCLLHKVV
jgi:hypothetical protein